MTFEMEMINLLNDLLDKRLREILIGCIASIEKHDTKTMRADIKPLIKFTPIGNIKSENYAVIPNIPVLFLNAGGFYIRPEYKRGDLVWVTFATHGTCLGLGGFSDSTDESIFNRESAAIAHGIAPSGWKAPKDISKSGLVIGHNDGDAMIQITDKKINIKGDINIEGSINVAGDVEAAGDVNAKGDVNAAGEVSAGKSPLGVKLSTHRHIATSLGSPTDSPTPGT